MTNILNKPYTDVQRANFICLHQGLNYYEDDNCIIMYSDSESVNNGVVTDISETSEYKEKVKKQKKNNSYEVYQKRLLQLKSEDGLNQFFKSCGTITQAEYDNRLAVIANDLETFKHTYLKEVADD